MISDLPKLFGRPDILKENVILKLHIVIKVFFVYYLLF